MSPIPLHGRVFSVRGIKNRKRWTVAFPNQQGKKFNSKFRANKSDKMSAAKDGMEKTDGSNPGDATPEQKGGNRAQATRIEGKAAANRSSAQPDGEASAGLAAQHGPANEVHIVHDHANGQHHVTTV